MSHGNHFYTWRTLTDAHQFAEAETFVLTLPDAIVNEMLRYLANACDSFDGAHVNAVLISVIAHPGLTHQRLSLLINRFVWDRDGTTELARRFFTHPNFSEELVQQLLYASVGARLYQLAFDHGWYYPVGACLARSLRDERPMGIEYNDYSVLLANELRTLVAGDPPEVGRVVRSLGLTWTETLSALVATARGILA